MTEEVYAKALRLLAKREHSRADLLQRLSDVPQSTLQAVLDRLEREGCLSDERVAEALQRRAARRHGLLRLQQDFRQHGIDDAIARPRLEEAARQELALAQEVRAARFADHPRSPEEWAKQARYLHYRGFTAETIRRVLARTAGTD